MTETEKIPYLCPPCPECGERNVIRVEPEILAQFQNGEDNMLYSQWVLMSKGECLPCQDV